MTDWIRELEEAIGADKVLPSPIDLVAYSFDGTFEQHLPDVVVLAETNADVSAVIEVASEHRVPIVPRGMSSGLRPSTVLSAAKDSRSYCCCGFPRSSLSTS